MSNPRDPRSMLDLFFVELPTNLGEAPLFLTNKMEAGTASFLEAEALALQMGGFILDKRLFKLDIISYLSCFA